MINGPNPDLPIQPEILHSSGISTSKSSTDEKTGRIGSKAIRNSAMFLTTASSQKRQIIAKVREFVADKLKKYFSFRFKFRLEEKSPLQDSAPASFNKLYETNDPWMQNKIFDEARHHLERSHSPDITKNSEQPNPLTNEIMLSIETFAKETPQKSVEERKGFYGKIYNELQQIDKDPALSKTINQALIKKLLEAFGDSYAADFATFSVGTEFRAESTGKATIFRQNSIASKVYVGFMNVKLGRVIN